MIGDWYFYTGATLAAILAVVATFAVPYFAKKLQKENKETEGWLEANVENGGDLR